MNILRALVLAVAVASPATALAAEMTVGGRVLHIAPPPGFCALDRSNDVDAMLFDVFAKMQRGHNELVDFWAECQSLASYRAGLTADLTPYVMILAQLAGKDRVTPADLPLADYLAEIRRALDKQDGGKALITDDTKQMVRERLDEALADLGATKSLQLGETRMLGMIAEDDTALYLAMLQRLDDGVAEVLLGVVVGMTELNGISVSVNLYDDHTGSESLAAMQARTKAIVAQLVTANPTTAKSRFDLSRIFDGTLSSAITGAIVAIALGFIGLRRLRSKN